MKQYIESFNDTIGVFTVIEHVRELRIFKQSAEGMIDVTLFAQPDLLELYLSWVDGIE